MTATLLKQAREALENAAQELHHLDAGPIKELGGVIAEVEAAAAALDAHAALSPAPVEALPEGCPEAAFFSPSVGFFRATGDENNVPPDDTAPVEIHPVGTRARLGRLEREAKGE